MTAQGQRRNCSPSPRASSTCRFLRLVGGSQNCHARARRSPASLRRSLPPAKAAIPSRRPSSRAEARALVEAAVVGAARLSFRSPPRIGLAGGVLHKSAYYRKLVEEELERQGLTDKSYRNVHLISGARAGAEYAQRLAGLLDDQPIPLPDGAVLGSLN